MQFYHLLFYCKQFYYFCVNIVLLHHNPAQYGYTVTVFFFLLLMLKGVVLLALLHMHDCIIYYITVTKAITISKHHTVLHQHTMSVFIILFYYWCYFATRIQFYHTLFEYFMMLLFHVNIASLYHYTTLYSNTPRYTIPLLIPQNTALRNITHITAPQQHRAKTYMHHNIEP